MSDSWKKSWEVIKDLGAGGQGTVELVRAVTGGEVNDVLTGLMHSVAGLAPGVRRAGEDLAHSKRLRELIRQIAEEDRLENLGALKTLNDPEDARNPETAVERMARELGFMREVDHPNLLRIIDSDPDLSWYVSEYYPDGTLADSPTRYLGAAHEALMALRPLVQAVAEELHAKGIVHRDIKPPNVFVASSGRLVLGDFGLGLSVGDDGKTRISETFENVGTWGWMPPWAEEVRLEELSPTFDVFSLGKLLWSMITGEKKLKYWYWKDEENNVERLFPKAPGMRLVNDIFSHTIVEREKDCLSDAGQLLALLDHALQQISLGSSPLHDDVVRVCRVCGKGKYSLMDSTGNFGFDPSEVWSFKVMACDNCGHSDIFYFKDAGKPPPAWLTED